MEEELNKQEMSDVADASAVAIDSSNAPLAGRDAFIGKLRELGEELQDDVSDDALFDRAGGILGERDELRGKYDALNGANSKLAEVISESPEVAQFVAMLGNGEHWLYALGKSFGNLLDNLDDDTLDEYNKGKEEFKARHAKMRENFAAYKDNLKKYGEDNGLSDEQLGDINNAILDIAEALNTGDIPVEVIDNVWKGMDYDNEKTAEVEAAKLAGKNEAIDEMKSRKASPAPLPDLNARKTANVPVAKSAPTQRDAPFVDLLGGSEKIG